jgi:hypothetical protein
MELRWLLTDVHEWNELDDLMSQNIQFQRSATKET